MKNSSNTCTTREVGMYRVIYIVHYYYQQIEDVLKTFLIHFLRNYQLILSIYSMIVEFEIVFNLAKPQKSSPLVLVLEFEMYQCIFNVFGTPFLFQFPTGSYQWSHSWTMDIQRELFFKNSKVLGLGRQIGLKFWGAFWVFPAKLLALF